MTVAAERLAEWVSRLVRIPSVSPAHAGPRAGEPGEARLGGQVAAWFRELGGEVRIHEVVPGRANVYGIWRGRSDRWAGVDAHLDTVSVEQMTGDPFSGEVTGGRVHGRGAVDTKATLGVALALLEEMSRTGAVPASNLLVAATVDEEDGALGAPAFAAWLREQGLALDELSVAEPTGCAPVVAHRGVLRVEFSVEGIPAHSSEPELGRNAVTAAARLALALDEENRRLQAAPETRRVPGHPGCGCPGPLGPGTLTVTQIAGGRGANVVPDSCSLGIDRRVAPGEDGAAVLSRLKALAEAACPLPVSSRVIKLIQPFAQDPGSPWVRRLAEWSGLEPRSAPYCTNAWAYGGAARECVVLGPGSIEQAHGAVEWVEIAELEKLGGIFARWWGVE